MAERESAGQTEDANMPESNREEYQSRTEREGEDLSRSAEDGMSE